LKSLGKLLACVLILVVSLAVLSSIFQV
jgi:hypothetical protein